jgi:hypothetical protein
MLPALDIIGQASSDATGRSSAEARAVLPLYMALILGEPGAAAAMDPDLRKLKWWAAMASVDDRDTTRVTAIQALSGICRKALIDGQLDVVSRGVEAMDQLLELIPDDESLEAKNLRTKALTAKSLLARHLRKRPDLLVAAKLSGNSLVSDNPELLRKKIETALLPATDALLKIEKELSTKVHALPDATKSGEAPEVIAVIADSKRTLAVTKTVFETARKDILDQPMPPTSPGPSSVVPPAKTKLEELIGMLGNKNTEGWQRATADLALVGQDAVKRLMKEIEIRNEKDSPEDNNVRLGVAIALKHMRQPITFDREDAKWITSLLGAAERDTRVAAADFLMDLWDGPSIHAAFEELQRRFDPQGDPESAGYHINYYVALVVATWARNLNDSILAPDPSKKMNTVALEKAKEWRSALATSQQGDRWKRTLAMLDDLIARAGKPRPA